MSGSTSKQSPPANEPVQNANGALADTWRAHFQEVADLAGSAWLVGDYKQTIQPDLGPNWLLCDGRILNDVDYPDLAKLLKPSDPNAGKAGVFALPTVAPIPTGGDVATVQTWVRAL